MVVIKIGGGTDIDLDAVADDIAELLGAGRQAIVVHGGSGTLDRVAEQLGHPPEFVQSPSGYTSRRTDRRTLEIFEMVYCGQVNKGLVERFQRRNINAVGLSGLDGRVWEGPRKATIRIVKNGKQMVLRDDYTGKVERVNVGLLTALAGEGYLPVISPPAVSYEGEAINVDGDRGAAQTAVALGAEALVILSNVPGLLADFPDEESLIPEIAFANLERYRDVAKHRMKKKVLGAAEALAGGVKRVIFADGRVERPVHRALSGHGTVISG